MSNPESFHACYNSRPLLYDHGNYRDSTLSCDGSDAKPPDEKHKPCTSLVINSSDVSDPKKPLGQRLTSFISTKWRYVFLAMITSVQIGW